MKALRQLIEEELMLPLSMFIKDEKVVPLYGTEDESVLFASEIAKREGVCLAQGDINRFLQESSEGYVLYGFWGHGISSYGIYLQKIDAWRKLFFRLPYGNAFENRHIAGRQVREFLINYFNFEKRIRDKVESIIVIESMWEGFSQITPKNGETIKFEGSLFKNPDFMRTFSILFAGEDDEEI